MPQGSCQVHLVENSSLTPIWQPSGAQPGIQGKGFLGLPQEHDWAEQSMPHQWCLSLHGLCNQSTLEFVFFQLGSYTGSSELRSPVPTCWPAAAQSLHTDEGVHHKWKLSWGRTRQKHNVRFEADNARPPSEIHLRPMSSNSEKP